MAYSPSEDLQRMIYARLTTDASVTALVSDRIFDKAPSQETFPYISFGPTDVVEDDADCIVSGDHSFQVDVWSRYHGKLEAKSIVGAVKKSLHGYDGALMDNALVFMRVTQTLVMDDSDGATTHGIVTVQAMIEEAA